MLRFSIKLILALFAVSALSQENKQSADTVVHKEKYGLRVGIDLSKPLRAALDENYKGLELVGDIRISQKFFVAAELGTEEKTTQEDNFTFFTKGSYLKAGFDYNAYENWYGMQNMIHAGLRVGVGTFSHTLNEYTIYNSNQFWQENSIPGEAFLGDYDGLSAQWLELVVGLKAELFANLYLGASLRINYLVNEKESDIFPNLYIPGFNKVTDGSRFGAGYNYTITYFIPVLKIAKKKAEKKKKTEEK